MTTMSDRARPGAFPSPSRAVTHHDGVRLLVELAGVEKDYGTGSVTTPALRGVDLDIAAGEMVAVVGPSGSGKSTITNLIAGIDRPTAGTVTVGGRRIDALGEEDLARWRGETVGIVFQFFQLLPTLTASENVALPLDFARRGSARSRRRRARDLLGLVGLGDKARRLPAELSGGEQQRVAIARALACEPALLIGDEPTGNLDSHTAGEMFDLLVDVHRRGTTVVFVTHDAQLAARAPRTVTVRDGRIVDDTGPGDLRRPAAARMAAVPGGPRTVGGPARGRTDVVAVGGERTTSSGATTTEEVGP